MPFLGLGLHAIVAIFFAIHAYRTGRPMYWMFILFAFPLFGSIAYFFAEFLPQTRLERGLQQGLKQAGRQVTNVLDPGRELRAAKTAYEISPTAQHEARLASALLEKGQPDEALRHFRSILAGPFGAEPDVRFQAARAFMTTGDLATAADLLGRIRADSATYRPADVLVILAEARWGNGDVVGVKAALAEAATSQGSFDTRAEYAIFCLATGDVATARRLQHDLDIDMKTWNSTTRKFYKPVVARLEQAWSKSGDAA
jgi:hypothetical protein